MATYFRMPGVSADSEEAVLESWTVEPGARVSSGQAIATVETEKAVVDVEVDADAIVHTLLVSGGATVPVGDPIAVLLGVDEPSSEAEKLLAELGVTGAAPVTPPATPAAPPAAGVPAPPAAVPAVPAAPAAGAVPAPNGVARAARAVGGRQFTSPSARRMARELGIDITTVTGTGPKGRVVVADVRSAAAHPAAPAAAAPVPVAALAPVAAPAAPVAAPAAVAAAAPAAAAAVPPGWTAVPHSKLRRLVASRLQASKQTVPHFYLRRSVQAGALLALREQINAAGRHRISVNDFIVKAAAQALLDVPAMNVIWTDDAVLQAPRADVAVAVASERGLVTPVITDAGSLSLSALSARIKDVVGRANEGRLQQSELEGGTLTVSNLGMFGIEEFDAIINPPQAGILAVGAVTSRPVVGADGAVEVGPVLSLVLSVDHRPVDGADGARWLARLTQLLESPLQIVV